MNLKVHYFIFISLFISMKINSTKKNIQFQFSIFLTWQIDIVILIPRLKCKLSANNQRIHFFPTNLTKVWLKSNRVHLCWGWGEIKKRNKHLCYNVVKSITINFDKWRTLSWRGTIEQRNLQTRSWNQFLLTCMHISSMVERINVLRLL